jgi:alpha-tubulin suppressor-like RCC1 family protein
MAAGGFGHTLALTTQGEIFSWGLDVKGQLGLGEYLRKTGNTKGALYEPTQIEFDAFGNKLPTFKSVACGFNRSFAIDSEGFAWAWGQGNIGFKDV